MVQPTGGRWQVLRQICHLRRRSLLLLVFWKIWNERNGRIFRHKESSIQTLLTKIKEEARTWHLAGAKCLTVLWPGDQARSKLFSSFFGLGLLFQFSLFYINTRTTKLLPLPFKKKNKMCCNLLLLIPESTTCYTSHSRCPHHSKQNDSWRLCLPI